MKAIIILATDAVNIGATISDVLANEISNSKVDPRSIVMYELNDGDIAAALTNSMQKFGSIDKTIDEASLKLISIIERLSKKYGDPLDGIDAFRVRFNKDYFGGTLPKSELNLLKKEIEFLALVKPTSREQLILEERGFGFAPQWFKQMIRFANM